MVVDLGDPATIQDPYAAYARLRAEAPVHRWPSDVHPRGGMWVVSRYHDVAALLADDRFTKRADRVGLELDTPPILMFLDPPEHTRLRRMPTGAFTRRQVERLRRDVEDEVAALLAPLRDGQAIDVVADLAEPLPLHTILRLLGLPLADGPRLRYLTHAILDGTDSAREGDVDVTDVEAADRELAEHMAAYVAARATQPGDDLTSAMLRQVDEDGTMRPDEVAPMCAQLLVNGHETTVNLIGTGLYHLLRHREEWERLVADPTLVDSAVEECLRYDAPNQRTSARYALEAIEIAGTTIAAGEQVAGILGSANRDGEVFADPDRLDVARSPNPHLSFGRGRHHCPGAALTRLEMAAVLAYLVRHAPDLDLVGTPPVYRDNSFDRGLVALTIARR